MTLPSPSFCQKDDKALIIFSNFQSSFKQISTALENQPKTTAEVKVDNQSSNLWRHRFGRCCLEWKRKHNKTSDPSAIFCPGQ